MSAILTRPLVLHFGTIPGAGDQRVTIYPPGGIQFETFVNQNIGWVLEEDEFNPILDNLGTLLHETLVKNRYIQG